MPLCLVGLLVLLLRCASSSEEVPTECLPTEFLCANGQCVDGARFCDGNLDCEDSSDEPEGCTNCNRTYHGLLDVKYPLRLSEPVVHRRLSSLACSFTFVAAGGRYGDVVEVTFLSFQIGTFQLESSTCSSEYMEVEDLKAPTQLRKRSIKPPRKSKKKGLSNKKETAKKRMSDKTSTVGSFCGPMIGPSATFYSTGNRVKLTVVMPTQVSGQTVVPRLYLTYRFLRRGTVHPSQLDLSAGAVPGTKCDEVLTNCHEPHCVIRSPNFPGFYLRNISCHYWIRQEFAPPGRVAQIEVFQKNEFKINILSGHTNNDRYKPGILTSECAGDVIRVFDGRTAQSPLLAEFCGAGTLPVIRSSGPDMLLQLISAASQPLASYRFELDVRVRFVSDSAFRMVSDQCSLTVDGSRHPFGILHIPDHSIPSETTCSFRVIGKPNDRIWLYFVVYNVPDLNPWTDDEKCDVGKLEIIHPKPKLRHSHHHYHYPQQTGDQSTTHNSASASNRKVYDSYCEKRSPRQCGHASDFMDYVPSRPCLVPNESYLSPGPELILELSFFKAMAIHGSSPHFVARYEVVEMEAVDVPDKCTVVIRSRDSSFGSIESPRNLFLYGRGGASDLNCKYELRGAPDEKVRITVNKIYFRSVHCTTVYRPVVQRHDCNITSSGFRHAAINVSETWHELRVFIGCVCDSPYERSVSFESMGPHVDLNFVVRNMGPRDDFRTFHFVLKYEFVAVPACGTERDVMNGIQGQLVLDYTAPIQCRWLLAALPSRALYITLRGHKLDAVCKNKLLFYGIESQQPYAAFCASEDEQQESFFSLSWRQDTRDARYRYSPDLTVLELIANQPGRFRLHWVEVTRPTEVALHQRPLVDDDDDRDKFPDPCPLECPELEACISPDLACDGTRHCPASATDEAPERCVQFPLLTVAVSCATAVMIVVVIVLGVVVWHRLARVNKTVIPPPDLFKSDCKDSSLKGHVR